MLIGWILLVYMVMQPLCGIGFGYAFFSRIWRKITLRDVCALAYVAFE